MAKFNISMSNDYFILKIPFFKKFKFFIKKLGGEGIFNISKNAMVILCLINDNKYFLRIFAKQKNKIK
jgi:hypothetical protein